MAETQEIIQREAAPIEALKIGLMEQAKSLTGAPPTGGLPAIQSQGLDPLQARAAQLATQGVGSYQPFLTGAQGAFSSGLGSLTATQPYAQQILGGLPGQAQAIDTRTQQVLGVVPGQAAREAAMAQGLLGGGIGAYDPRSAAAFMNPYQQVVADEINRAYDIQQSQLGQRQAQAGAFGGSRAAIEQSELNRNRADALARAQAENFVQAQQAAMNAYEAQQGRQLQAGQIGGQLGLQSADLARQAALGGGQLGLQGLDVARSAGMGIGQLGLEQAGALGQLGVQQAALGELGANLNRADIQTLSTLGEQQRQIDQQALEAQRQTQLQQIYEPYQRLSFYSDILRGAPSTQQTLSVTSSPNPSLLNQVIGAGTTALGMYGAANKTGLI